jgi:hypothetical protein
LAPHFGNPEGKNLPKFPQSGHFRGVECQNILCLVSFLVIEKLRKPETMRRFFGMGNPSISKVVSPRGQDLLPTSAAAGMLGISPDQFRRLAERLNLEPASSYTNPHYRSGPRCPLWSPKLVQGLIGREELANLRARCEKHKKAKSASHIRRLETLHKRYPDWKEAIPPAAEALFNLNRYAKWESCSREHKKEIYDLKNKLIGLLYSLGYANQVKEHVVSRPGLSCNKCSGTGEIDDWNEYKYDDFCAENGTCSRCDGTGWYRGPDCLEFVAFRFSISGQWYSWHQPKDLVSWPYAITCKAEDWEPERDAKPIDMPKCKFSEAKALIRFVLEKAKGNPERDPINRQ